MTPPTDNDVTTSRRNVQHALDALANSRTDLADTLSDFVAAIAVEAERNSRFARSLTQALATGNITGKAPIPPSNRRPRREPGPWDPYVIYTESGEQGLRERLHTLNLEQLRNIVAEHSMDNDRLAMKWRNPERVIERIIERVVDRAAKGDSFRDL